jgi:hypothetical protein
MLVDFACHLIVSILETFLWDGELVGGENLHDGPENISKDFVEKVFRLEPPLSVALSKGI